jgi:hypothetical protein
MSHYVFAKQKLAISCRERKRKCDVPPSLVRWPLRGSQGRARVSQSLRLALRINLMSFSFSAFFAAAESALASAYTVAKPIVALVRQAEPIVEAFVPSSVPVIIGIEAGVKSIEAMAPNAVRDATNVIAAGRSAYADIAPSLLALETAFSDLFHMNVMPGGQTIILTAKTSAATAAVPAIPPAPGNALS